MTAWSDDVRRRLTQPEAARPAEPAPPVAAPGAPPWRRFSGRPAQLDLPQYGPAARRRGARSLGALRALVGHDDLSDRVATAGDRLGTSVVTGRRIAVVGAVGGSGATTLTTLLARSYGIYRPDRTLVAAGTADHGSLATRLGIEAGATEHTAATRLDEAVFATSCTMTRIVPLDGGVAVIAGHDGDPHALRRTIVRMASAVAVAITDAGRDVEHPTLRDAHAIAVTTPRTLDGTVAAAEVAATLQRRYPQAAVLVVCTDTGVATGITQQEQTAYLLERGHTVARLPHDRHLAAGARIDLGRLSQGARLATLEAAGDIVAAAARRPRPNHG